MKEKIKVGFCVAYDWKLLEHSLPLVYPHADSICLSIDKNRRSWSGLPYHFDESSFLSLIAAIDTDHKICIYEDDFSFAELSAIENDNRQRSMMAERMGIGGWHIQVDSDEYFIDFEGFCDYLQRLNINQKEVNICCPWISLYKRLGRGYLYIPFSKLSEFMPFATNKPYYSNARRNGYFNHFSPFFVVHDTWSRSEETLRQKLGSWGHADDFNHESYLKIWRALDEQNYNYVHNLHPIKGTVWPTLNYMEASNPMELVEKFRFDPPQISKNWLKMKNSRLVAKIRSLLHD